MNATPDNGLILDIDALAPIRPRVRIKSKLYPEGKMYELVSADELDIEKQAELANRGKAMQRLVKRKGVPTVEQAQELDLVLDAIVSAVVIDLEDAVRESLKAPHKVAIANAFIEVSPDAAAAVEAMKPTSPPTSAS